MNNKTIDPNKEIVVIYHGSCNDGFCGAFLFWLILGDKASYYAGYYNEPAPDVTGKIVYIVDFSYPEAEIYKIAETAKELIWLDHHASVEELAAKVAETTDKSKVIVDFDNNRSGARLAYDFIMNMTSPEVDGYNDVKVREWLVNYVQDYDLWTFKLEDTKAVNLAIRSERMTFKNWLEFSETDLVSSGRAVKAYHDAKINEVVRLAYQKNVLGHEVMIVNCNGMFASEVGNELAKDKPFSLSWWYDGKNKMFVFSLRSDEKGVDVGELAKSVGGGGHKHAAGFKLKPEDVDKILDLE